MQINLDRAPLAAPENKAALDPVCLPVNFLSQNLEEKTFFIILWKSEFRPVNDCASRSRTTGELFRGGKASRVETRSKTI
jgi:hypothetical protein